MKRFQQLISIIILTIAVQGFSQDMKSGFTYLEKGEYGKAVQFFDQILQDHPKNKTARLCYGRAVGLNGDSKRAYQLFTHLLNDFPNDFEVKLNLAESLLWNKNFIEAETYYEKLIELEPSNFPALLGYANTLSNLKKYEEAIIAVNQALSVSPRNGNALTSKKYIYLGFAYQNQQQQRYNEAEELLLTNLELFPDDLDTQKNLANLYLIVKRYADAGMIYEQLKGKEDSQLTGLNGLSLVSHLEKNEKRALQLSTEAYNSLTKRTSSDLRIQTIERYVQALIWNRSYKKAEHLINELMSEYGKVNWVLALRATLNIYKSNFKDSLSDYNQILENDSLSFDGNLGKANALKALGRIKKARSAAKQTLEYYEKQQDATIFIEELDRRLRPSFESKVSHTFDNGNNIAYSLVANLDIPLSRRWKILGSYQFRNASNTQTNNEANSNGINLGASYLMAPKIAVKGLFGVTSANTNNNNYSQFSADMSISIQSLKLQSLDLGYQRQVESFNADLLERELVQHNYYAIYNLSTNFNLGWYSQLIYTSQNDGNSRNLLFTSLYYSIFNKPIVKAGINYQYLSFKDQVPAVYFSPETFHATEVFINLVRDENSIVPKKWFYNLTAAYGYQFINSEITQNAYRFQATIGYKFSHKGLVNLYGTRSNIASATAAGFTFTEIGIRGKWIL